ncbi:hypothetical protein ACPOL_5853 [Acidisarcina polymorpha]|uniref:Uncharacterized protein n=1 Tax=Acidisarcina polymorpha TaxID=2211140 RepID=A0A2Z5G8E9_9BACT|nr:hypothetical protein ACPOL_5853 [Acidisarcina polymorpha]
MIFPDCEVSTVADSLMRSSNLAGSGSETMAADGPIAIKRFGVGCGGP